MAKRLLVARVYTWESECDATRAVSEAIEKLRPTDGSGVWPGTITVTVHYDEDDDE